jgi:RNA polymerase sigma-70 factor (ECF subfamily)
MSRRLTSIKSAASCVARSRIEDIEHLPDANDPRIAVETNDAAERLNALIRQLKPADRQIITLYLEGCDAAEIATITGLTPGAIAARVSRAKAQLNRLFKGSANV